MVELFHGSKSELEEMTGKQYEYIKGYRGGPLAVESRGINYGLDAAEMDLNFAAVDKEADALVHVSFYPDLITKHLFWFIPIVTGNCIRGFGYAVKEENNEENTNVKLKD